MATVSGMSNLVLLTLGKGPDGKDDPPSALRQVAGQVLSAASPAEGVRLARENAPDVAVVREGLPTGEALALVEAVREHAPATPVVVITRSPSATAAAKFLRAGASACVSASLDETDLAQIAKAAEANGGAAALRKRFFSSACPPGVPIVGHSGGLNRALEMIRLVAESHCDPILILGETGTGKELAARAVHCIRHGRDGDFVAVNCATLTANLLESELFGHVKGAFTGADSDKAGLLEKAGSGSLFLDEVSEMPLNLQAKLLRVLQERTFRKVGGTEPIPFRATIIASSNRDLTEEARQHRFRQDLYYRLAVFPIALPPLRSTDRRDDIVLTAEYFAQTSASASRKKLDGFDDRAKQRLLAHAWPGNVRELRNVVERACILERSDRITCESLLLDDHLSAAGGQVQLRVPEDDFSLETAEQLFIRRALKETGWQRTRAAALLGITRATLHAKLKRYRIDHPDPGQADPTPPGVPPCPAESRFQEATI